MDGSRLRCARGHRAGQERADGQCSMRLLPVINATVLSRLYNCEQLTSQLLTDTSAPEQTWSAAVCRQAFAVSHLLFRRSL